MELADTSPDVRERQFDAYRSMTPERRAEIAFEMSDQARVITLDGIRARHPGYDERAVSMEYLRVVFGKTLAEQLAPILDP